MWLMFEAGNLPLARELGLSPITALSLTECVRGVAVALDLRGMVTGVRLRGREMEVGW